MDKLPRKGIFFTSDWHNGHANVLNFCNRPFKDLDHMHRVLINNYNSTVPPEGLCYFGGDMGLGEETLFNIINKLNGTKVLILGNHDKGPEAMYRLGFDVVTYGVTLQIAKQRVTLTHCPLLGVPREDTTGMKGSDGTENWHGESREKSQRFTTQNIGQFHLHGHIHSPNRGKSKKIFERQYDIGVDANDYRPVSIKEIESWINRTVSNGN